MFILSNQDIIRDTNGIEKEETIQDIINQPIENTVIGGTMQRIEDIQKELWAREDAIRKETQAREDSAYQRAVADMRAAGINPNLMDVNPADSGGGITSATKKDYTELELQMERNLELLKQQLDQEFQMDQNAKDRVVDLVKTIFGAYVLGSVRK